MSHPKIAFVVGHASWGKSRTLRALTGGSQYVRAIEIKRTRFLLRRMSNDDRPASFNALMSRLDPSSWSYAIAALCPNFADSEFPLGHVLENLRAKGYRLYFWVIEHQFGTSAKVLSPELAALRRFGQVEVYSERSEAQVRAETFQAFIKQVVLA